MGLPRFAAGFLLEDIKKKLYVKFYCFTHSFLNFM